MKNTVSVGLYCALAQEFIFYKYTANLVSFIVRKKVDTTRNITIPRGLYDGLAFYPLHWS